MLALRGGAFWPTAGMPFSRQARFPLVREDIPLATDRTGGRLHVARHLTDAPADVPQGHRDTTTNFQLLFGA